MKTKGKWSIALIIVLIVCASTYFKPLAFSDLANENSDIRMIFNEYSIDHGKPDIRVTEYQEITAEQKGAVLEILEKYTYSRTVGTLFSDGTMSDMGNKVLYIYIFNSSSDSHALAIASNEIAVSGKNYRMKNADQLMDQLVAIVEQTD